MPYATGYDKDDNQAIGRSVGGVTTKIYAMTDALGNPMEILLSEGKTHDSKVAIDLLQNVYNTKVIADRAYLRLENIFKIYPQKPLFLVNQIL